jgi:hypothetical protein
MLLKPAIADFEARFIPSPVMITAEHCITAVRSANSGDARQFLAIHGVDGSPDRPRRVLDARA